MTTSLPGTGTLKVQGKPISLRPCTASDRELIVEFGRGLPRHDLLFLRRDISDPLQVMAWLAQVEAGLNRTTLAIADGAVVGYSCVQTGGLHWTRDIAEVRLLVAPDYRNQHLGRVLLQWAFDTALQDGARKLVAQITADQESARKLFERLGFSEEARLRNHVTDVDGAARDLVVMSFFPEEQALPSCDGCGRSTLTRLRLEQQDLCWSCYNETSRELGGG